MNVQDDIPAAFARMLAPKTAIHFDPPQQRTHKGEIKCLLIAP
jgi:hypothetical protein